MSTAHGRAPSAYGVVCSCKSRARNMRSDSCSATDQSRWWTGELMQQKASLQLEAWYVCAYIHACERIPPFCICRSFPYVTKQENDDRQAHVNSGPCGNATKYTTHVPYLTGCLLLPQTFQTKGPHRSFTPLSDFTGRRASV